MAAINTRDVALQATSPRLIPAGNAAIILDSTANSFHVAVGGANDPASITFTARFIAIEGTVTFSITGGTLTSVSGNTCVLTYANMSSATATVTATITYRGTVFTSTSYITKVLDGATGSNGTNGSRVAGHFYATGSSWSDATADAATPGANVVDDVVTISNGSTYVLEKRWTGSAWVANGVVIDGSLIVTNSILTSALAANSVTTDKLVVGSKGGVLSDDPALEDAANAWALQTGVALNSGGGSTTGASGDRYFSCSTLDARVYSKRVFVIDRSKTYNLSANLYTDSGNNRQVIVYLDFYDSTGAMISGATTGWGGTESGYTYVGVPTAGVFTRCGGQFGASVPSRLIPSAAVTVRVGVWFQYAGSGSSSIRQVAQDIRLELTSDTTTIADGAITANKISVTNLAAINAELGSAVISTTGSLRSGQTAYNTGTGFWLGLVSGTPKFSIGVAGGPSMRWDGSQLVLSQVTFDSLSVTLSGSLATSVANGLQGYGNLTATASGGTVQSYTWSITYGSDTGAFCSYSIVVGDGTATISLRGNVTNNMINANISCTVTFTDGRTRSTSTPHSVTHGTYAP